MIKHFTGQYAFLSNFYPSPIVVQEFTYPTMENFFQAQKAVGGLNHLRIMNAPTAADAKRIGRAIELRSDWESIKLLVMRLGLGHKFGFGTPLAQRLLETCDEQLCEGNTWGDTFWGVDQHGSGLNWLGHLLMARRAELRGH